MVFHCSVCITWLLFTRKVGAIVFPTLLLTSTFLSKQHKRDACLNSICYRNWTITKKLAWSQWIYHQGFDMLPHDLIMEKLKQHADEIACDLIKYYLSKRKQRVKLCGVCSSWETIVKEIPQGSFLGPLLFNIFMNDLHLVTENTTLSTNAGDTQIFYAGNDTVEVEQAINSDLRRVDNWFDKNGKKRSPSKYKVIFFGNSHSDPKFVCENTVIPLEDGMDLLVVTIDSKLKFDAHVAKICLKVSQQVAVLKRMKKIVPFDTRMNLYRAPHFNYCTETWPHFCSRRASHKLEKN